MYILHVAIYIHIYKKPSPCPLHLVCKFQENRTSNKNIYKIWKRPRDPPQLKLKVLFFIYVSRSVNCKTCSVLVLKLCMGPTYYFI